jgi:hypothetical protein
MHITDADFLNQHSSSTSFSWSLSQVQNLHTAYCNSQRCDSAATSPALLSSGSVVAVHTGIPPMHSSVKLGRYIFYLVSRQSYVILFLCLQSNGPPLWSCSQSSWLQIQRSRARFPALSDFLEVVGLERGLLSLVRIIEELFE